MVQGAGGAALLSTAQATLRQIFPREQQSMVQAIFLLGIIVAPTLGPTLGGWITDNYTWNWCFFINVPIGILAGILVFTFLQDPPGRVRRTGPIDFFGISLLAVGLSSLQYVLEEGQQDDWFNDVWIVRLTALSTVCLLTMLWWELSPRNRAPVVDFRVLKNRDLVIGHLPVYRAGVRPVRRHVPVSAVLAKPAGVFAHYDRSRPAAGRTWHGGQRHHLRAHPQQPQT